MKKTISIEFILVLVLTAGVANADFTFGEPTNLGPTVNTSSFDSVPTISGDGLELYFMSNRPGGEGGYDIWVTTRTTTADDWGPPVNLGPTVNSSSSENSPSISADGLELYFSDWGAPRPGGVGDSDLWVTTRPTKDEEWGEPVNLGSAVNSSALDGGPDISADGLSLFFYSRRSGGHGNFDLWVVTRTTTEDGWGTALNLGSTVNGARGDHCPDISADGLSLFFTSQRSGGYGNWDLFVTRRTTIDGDWGTPAILGSTVNSSAWEGSSSISADGSTLFFWSDRSDGHGADDLWQVSIVPIVDFNGDQIVDGADMDIMIGHWGGNDPLCDIGPTPLGDGIVDARDMLVLTEYLAKQKLDVEADIAAVKEVLNQYTVGVNTGDLELWLSLHADDVVKMEPDVPAIFGKEELRAFFKPLFDDFITEMALYPEEAHVEGNLGFARGTYTLSITSTEGGEPFFVDGKYLTLCKRQADGSWKISHDCYNSNVSPL